MALRQSCEGAGVTKLSLIKRLCQPITNIWQAASSRFSDAAVSRFDESIPLVALSLLSCLLGVSFQ